MPKVLMIVTSHAALGSTGQKTGFWLEELAVPYQTLRRGGLTVDIASPRGGQPPVDPKSEKDEKPEVKAFLADPAAGRALASTLPLSEVRDDYDAFFVVGGHGVMWDLAEDARLQELLGKAHAAGKVVAAVCHGPAALVGVRTPAGAPLVAGKRVAGFSDEEEAAVGLAQVVPFALESKLRSLGGKYQRGPTWASFAVVDGHLVTGQNPASSGAVAESVLKLLQPTRASQPTAG
jgi:putative intracellular protease/amidase